MTVDVVTILVALLLAALVYIIAGLFLPSPVPLILALIVLLVSVTRGVS